MAWRNGEPACPRPSCSSRTSGWRVPVQDADPLPARRVALEVPEGGFVAAAEDDDERPGRQVGRHGLPEQRPGRARHCRSGPDCRDRGCAPASPPTPRTAPHPASGGTASAGFRPAPPPRRPVRRSGAHPRPTGNRSGSPAGHRLIGQLRTEEVPDARIVALVRREDTRAGCSSAWASNRDPSSAPPGALRIHREVLQCRLPADATGGDREHTGIRTEVIEPVIDVRCIDDREVGAARRPIPRPPAPASPTALAAMLVAPLSASAGVIRCR